EWRREAPWASGPRGRIAAVIRPSTSRRFSRGRFTTNPAIPHMPGDCASGRSGEGRREGSGRARNRPLASAFLDLRVGADARKRRPDGTCVDALGHGRELTRPASGPPPTERNRFMARIGGRPPVLREELPRRGAELERQRRRSTAVERGPRGGGGRGVRL